jgi:hypothetical protein
MTAILNYRTGRRIVTEDPRSNLAKVNLSVSRASSSKSRASSRPQIDGIINEFLDVTGLYKYPEGDCFNTQVLIFRSLAERYILLSLHN